jgi:hypothetical protein
MALSSLRLLAWVLLPLWPFVPVTARAACDDLIPPSVPVDGPTRMVTPEDLVRLRDVGTPDASWSPPESPLSISRNGKQAAFVLTRADIGRNDYCRALVVLDLHAGAKPRTIDSGGDYIAVTYPVRGFMMSPGAPEPVTPAWSPDGTSIAYRKRVAGRTEAWVAAADGSGARSVARLATDVEALAWSADGLRLVVASRPGFAAQERAIAHEGLSGYLYDDRFQPYDANRPALTAGEQRVLQSAELATGLVTAASEADARRLIPDFVKGAPATLVASSPEGKRAWLARETKSLVSPMRVNVEGPGGQAIACKAATCAGSIPALFWLARSIVYLRREGWAKGTYALYRWKPGGHAPDRFFATEQAVHGCVPAGVRVACMVEDATMPQRLVLIDPRTGRWEAIFDPNPEFRLIRLGEVRRLKIRNLIGLEAWGDLVLPPDYKGGRIPLVVVQYHSDGFLRGGTGDDYPVHAFAARGLAVLSFERPQTIGSLDPNAATSFDLIAANTKAWADRRSILSAIEIGLDRAVQMGIADPQRIGMTGLSDGATTTTFALINSKRIAAAAISTCCMEPQMTSIYGGPRWAAIQQAQGYPPIGRDDPAFWAPMSLALNASHIDAPILMQLADREYLLGLESWAALKAAGKPVELYVYPDEYHNKWQPVHRLATYVRSLDWFDYWLADRRDPDPAKAGQYRRWDALKRLRAPHG